MERKFNSLQKTDTCQPTCWLVVISNDDAERYCRLILLDNNNNNNNNSSNNKEMLFMENAVCAVW